MARIVTRGVGRRRFRRPACLLAIGVTVGLGVAGAVAGAAMLAKAPRERATRSLSLRVAPSTRTVAPGDSATYAVRVAPGRPGRQGPGGRTRLSVGVGIPTGATVSFAPQSSVMLRGASHLRSKLSIHTSAGTAGGTYRFQVLARRSHRHGRTTVTLIVSAPAAAAAPTAAAPSAVAPPPAQPVVAAPDAFTISGTVPGLLIPGSEAPLDLSLTNLENANLSISGLTVRVAAVTAPRSDALHPCSLEDFSVAQFSGNPGFTLAASSTITLGELGFSPAQWPRVTMLDSAANQDGCKSATLRLEFAGTATEESP